MKRATQRITELEAQVESLKDQVAVLEYLRSLGWPAQQTFLFRGGFTKKLPDYGGIKLTQKKVKNER